MHIVPTCYKNVLGGTREAIAFNCFDFYDNKTTRKLRLSLRDSHASPALKLEEIKLEPASSEGISLFVVDVLIHFFSIFFKLLFL